MFRKPVTRGSVVVGRHKQHRARRKEERGGKKRREKKWEEAAREKNRKIDAGRQFFMTMLAGGF